MEQPGDHRSSTADFADLAEGIDRLGRRLDDIASDGLAQDGADDLLTELQVAYEELRVADEEVRTQQEQIDLLAESQQLLHGQRERMLELIPVPVVTTDRAGVVTSANAAAAAFLGVPLRFLVRKPLAVYVAIEDRADLRGAMATLETGWRRTIGLTSRQHGVVAVVAQALVDVTDGRHITWMFMVREVAGPLRRDGGRSLSEVLVQMARLGLLDLDRPALMARCADLAQEALGAGLSLTVATGSPGEPQSVNSTSPHAQAVDGAQIAQADGPSTSAYETRSPVVSDDLRCDPRWPRLTADPRCQQVEAVIAVPLDTDDQVLGTLTVYAEVGVALGVALVETVQLLASGIAFVLHELAKRTELTLTAAELGLALTSRAVIDQAKGMIMADRRCSADEAFAHLVRLSSSQHLKLRELAQQLVERRSEPAHER